MASRQASPKVVAAILIVSGVCCGIAALVSFLIGREFVQNASRAQGRVLEMVARDGENGVTYAPVFSFRDARGAEHTVYSTSSSYPPAHRIGDVVSVLYSPDDPRAAKIDGFFSLWGFPFIAGMIAAVHLPAGLIVWFWPAITRRFRKSVPVAAS